MTPITISPVVKAALRRAVETYRLFRPRCETAADRRYLTRQLLFSVREAVGDKGYMHIFQTDNTNMALIHPTLLAGDVLAWLEDNCFVEKSEITAETLVDYANFCLEREAEGN